MLNDPKWDIVFNILLYFKENIDFDITELEAYIDKKITDFKNLKFENLDFIKLLIFYIDEKVLNILNTNYSKWPLLQVKYFDTNIGGQLFFEIIYSNKDFDVQKLALILLKLGFKGRFFGDKDRILEYIQSLSNLEF